MYGSGDPYVHLKFEVTRGGTPRTTGEYSFTGTGCNGISITRGDGLVIGDCDPGPLRPQKNDSITNETTDNTIKIYPDPFCSTVTINNPTFSQGDFATLIDATGKLIKDIEITGQNSIINIDGLQNGVYFLNYHGYNGSTVKKLTKVCQ